MYLLFQRQFIKRLAILFVHLFMMSTAIYLRPQDPDKPLLGGMEWSDITRYCFEVGTVCGVLSYIIIQQGAEMLNQGFFEFIKQLVRYFFHPSFQNERNKINKFHIF